MQETSTQTLKTKQDVRKALRESGTRAFTLFHMKDCVTYVKITKAEAKQMLEDYGMEQISWSLDGSDILMSPNNRL